MIDKGRLLAITDGVIAIAATIMVLQLDIPEKASMVAVSRQWPTLVAYIISFLQIFLAWHEHHDSMARAEKINHRIFLLNCAWLFFITLLPFATGIVGRSADHMPSVLLYIVILFLVQLTITLATRSIQKLNGTEILDAPAIRIIRILTFAGYGVAALCSIIRPISGMFIIVAITLIEIVIVCLYDRKLESKHRGK